jgi:hypothetical protein
MTKSAVGLFTMASPDDIIGRWNGMIKNDFRRTNQETFGLSEDDDYKYRVEAFSMTLSEVEEALKSGKYYYWYSLNSQQLKVIPK